MKRLALLLFLTGCWPSARAAAYAAELQACVATADAGWEADECAQKVKSRYGR
jgi:hypothetical protein